jgi:regulatory protein
LSTARVSVDSASQGEIESTETSDEMHSRAMAIALRRLNAQQRTRSELAKTLREKGIPSPVSESVLERLSEMGYVNDAEFAQLWVRSRFRSRGLAPSVLRRELIAKGVDRETIEDALADINAAESLIRAREVALKKLRGLSRVDAATAVRRISAQLMRKGYSASDSVSVAKEVVGADLDESEASSI